MILLDAFSVGRTLCHKHCSTHHDMMQYNNDVAVPWSKQLSKHLPSGGSWVLAFLQQINKMAFFFSCGTVQAGYSPLSDWQVWQCGGSVEVLPCSRIAHIERAHKPYTENLTAHVRRNALRVAEVWMDQHKSHVYMAWNVPLQVRKHKARARGLCGCACTSACPVRDCCLCSGSASQIS